MKFLLTSEALANDALSGELLSLCGDCPASEISVAYVPTAAHGVGGDKRWLLRNLQSVARIPFRAIDVVELSDHSRARGWFRNRSAVPHCRQLTQRSYSHPDAETSHLFPVGD